MLQLNDFIDIAHYVNDNWRAELTEDEIKISSEDLYDQYATTGNTYALSSLLECITGELRYFPDNKDLIKWANGLKEVGVHESII